MSGCAANQMGYGQNGMGPTCVSPVTHEFRGSGYRGNMSWWSNREVAGKPELHLFNGRGSSLQVKMSHTSNGGWADATLNNTQYGDVTIKNGSDNGEPKGNIEFKVTGGTNNRIDNITHEARRLNLKGGSSEQLTVGTLTQTTTGDSQIFNNTTVHTLDLKQGKSYQRGGTIDNLIINGGEFHQGAKDNITAAENEGTINNLILTKGTFKHYKGTIKNITLTAPEPTVQAASVSSTQSSESSQSSDSPTTTTPPFTFQTNVSYTGNGNTTTNNGYSGLIQSVTQQDGKNTATLSNGTTIEATLTNSDPTNRTKGLTINNETGDLTNSGNLTALNITQSPSTQATYSTQESKSITNTAGANITTLTLFDGYTTINNYGTITTITHNQSGAAQSRSAAQTLAALTTPIIINNGEGGYISEYDARNNAKINNSGRIGTLTLKEDNNNITNNPKYDENGKLINGIIDKLVMSGGNNSINTLDGVAYDANTGMSTLDLQGGTLAVDTLSVGLNGNVAKHRIDLSSSGKGTLSVKNIEVAYVDGNFNPTKHINTDLKSYVNNGDKVTSQLDTNTPTTFRSSEQLQNLGITFNADGTPLFKVEDSIAADMTSLLIRQSMRRKMLIDTYLAEQSRRSLKNKERRTKQRIEANVLAQSKEQYEKDLAAYKQDKAKWDKLANSKENKALIAQYEKEYKAYEKAFKQYEKDKAKWEKLSDKDKAKLADKSKAPIAPIEPKAPTKPTAKEGDKDYKQVMADFDKAQKEHKKALSQYQKALKQYQKDKAKWEKENQKSAQDSKERVGTQAPIAPKEPTQPAILAQEPIMPIAPELHSSLESLYADAYGVKGDFFIRAFGGMGEHRLNDGTQTNSWSAGTLLGANWNLKFGNSQGNIGFYGGYEYLHNGYKRVDINAQGNTGFVGLRFSHLFAQTKLAGFYYVADVNGGYSDFMIAQTYVGMPYSARLGNINIGASMRLGSALYLNKGKSILFPSLGVGFEGGNIGEFELKTTAKENQLRSGGLSRSYAVAYAQANLNYYQEYGKRFSTTLGGGFRYLLNNEVEIAPTVNGIVFNANQQTGKIASVKLAPFFYQGTFMVNYHTDNAGNFSVGYVAVGGLLGITHNASMRWHYFF